MQKPKGEPQIALVLRVDIRDAVLVAQDLEACFEPLDGERARFGRQAGAQIKHADPSRRTAEQQQRRRQPQDPAHDAHGVQARFTMTVFFVVKCSSIASSVASFPRPEDLTPP